MTTSVVFTARPAPCDSQRFARPGRVWTSTIFAWLSRVLAFDLVQDLVRSVDRMPFRSLLKLGHLIARSVENAVAWALQPEQAWTINRIRWATIPNADGCAEHSNDVRALGNNEHTMSRAPCVVESPTSGISATHDETRATDQCGAARDARRDSGGRRAS